MDVSLHADRAYTGSTKWNGFIRVSGMSGTVAGGQGIVVEFVYLRAMFELVLFLSFLSSLVHQLAISRHLTECHSHTESLIPLSKTDKRRAVGGSRRQNLGPQ